MEPILQWGLDFIRAVQTVANPQLTLFMRIVTTIGGEALYMVTLLLMYWCINEKKGLRLEVMVLFSIWVNFTLKALLDQPRPFFEGYDPSVGIVTERMAGLPSGHAQNSFVLLFMIALWAKKNWTYILIAFICLLIGFTRIYLGVHFPSDVLAGWILGALIVGGYVLFNEKAEKLLLKGGYRACMITAAAVSFIMIIYVPNREAIMPGGTILGFCLGYCLNKRSIGFISALPDRKGLFKAFSFTVRMLLGFTVFIMIYYFGSKIIPDNSENWKLFGFLQAALMGFWVSAAAPWIFVKLRLADKVIETKANE
jgi:membrane-associated phospholipid phosphatase